MIEYIDVWFKGKKITLPKQYHDLSAANKRFIREVYVKHQKGLCWHCGQPLDQPPPRHITEKQIFWKAFPPGFLKNPVHLQHDHDTGMTEGAVHAYCNAVLWQYHGR